MQLIHDITTQKHQSSEKLNTRLKPSIKETKNHYFAQVFPRHISPGSRTGRSYLIHGSSRQTPTKTPPPRKSTLPRLPFLCKNVNCEALFL
ncbi:MAG: hypothetical protein KAS17_07750 [Victivallaceae bacterium]|nr:hypothetical protein [Victivallaceae bacterium]